MLLDSRESRKRNCKLQGLRHGNLAISSQQSRQKTTLAQWVTSFSRATNKPSTSYDDRAASGQSKQAAYARSAKVKPLHATLARRALLRLDSMAAPDPHSLGVPRPQFPRLCPACLPRYPLQTILRQVLHRAAVVGWFVLWRENHHRAILDFYNSIGTTRRIAT